MTLNKTIREWAEMYTAGLSQIEDVQQTIEKSVDTQTKPFKIKKSVIRDEEGRISGVIEEHVYD